MLQQLSLYDGNIIPLAKLDRKKQPAVNSYQQKTNHSEQSADKSGSWLVDNSTTPRPRPAVAAAHTGRKKHLTLFNLQIPTAH